MLLGSRGTGTSTILNGLMAGERQRTGGISETTGKGRHTTTLRELLVGFGGGVMIGTLDLREVALIANEEALSAPFGSTGEPAQGWRFPDCSHTTQPGCAVLRAVEAEGLAADRLESFHCLGREISCCQAVESTSSASGECAKWQSIKNRGAKALQEPLRTRSLDEFNWHWFPDRHSLHPTQGEDSSSWGDR